MYAAHVSVLPPAHPPHPSPSEYPLPRTSGLSSVGPSGAPERIHRCPVPFHSCLIVSQAYAVRLEMAAGWTVVYSGDTRPCDNVVTLGVVRYL